MMKLNVQDKEYKVKFGYNCFCDTDLIDRVQDMTNLFTEQDIENDKQASQIGKIKELFIVVRELLYYGFAKYNPVNNIAEIGDILDDYIDEEVEGEERGLLQLFTLLSNELFKSGFLSNLNSTTKMENGVKKPTDHLKKSVK